MRAPLAVLLVALSGCVSVPDLLAPPASDPGALVLPWTLTNCRYLVGWSNADKANVQAHLPAGFTAQGGAPFGLPLPVEQSIIGTETFDCESGAGLNGTLEPMQYASIWIPVTPPAKLTFEGIEEYYYKLHVLVPDAPRREALEARGASVNDGAFTWETASIPNGLATSLALDGVGSFRLDFDVPQQAQVGETTEFMEITPAGEMGERGFVLWRANYTWEGSTLTRGRGYIDWPEGHWVTEAIGSVRAPGSFHAGTWSFTGTVTLPSG